MTFDLFVSQFEESLGVVKVVLDVHALILSGRPGTKIADVLKMVDVPANSVDPLSEFIEDQMCSVVFFAVNVVNNVIGKRLDTPCVICECHGISLKKPARLRMGADISCSRARQTEIKPRANKKTVAGMPKDTRRNSLENKPATLKKM